MNFCRFRGQLRRISQVFSSYRLSCEEESSFRISMPPKGKSKAKSKSPRKRAASDDDSKAKKKSRKLSTSSSDGEASTSWDFSADQKHKKGKKSNWTIASWNVNGIRAWMKCKPSAYIKREDPDVFCVQETKCSEGEVPKEAMFSGYHAYWNYAEQKGYSGVGIYTRIKPLKVTYGIGVAQHDKEGRVITAEFDKFFLVTAYVPNSGRGLPRLGYRQSWDKDFRKYLKKLDNKKFVILCGDLNVAHEEIDLANPKSNKKTAGFTKEEREGFTELLDQGFVDTFRELYPDKKHAYTFWTYMRNARASNTGWRLDYFVTSEQLLDNVCDSVIRSRVHGSDHCPIVLHLAL